MDLVFTFLSINTIITVIVYTCIIILVGYFIFKLLFIMLKWIVIIGVVVGIIYIGYSYIHEKIVSFGFF